MNWRKLLPDVGVNIGIALVLGLVIAATTDIPFLLPLGVFIFCGPLAGLICEAITSRNPLYPEMKSSRSWIGTIAFLLVSIIVSAILTLFSSLGFWKSFAYTSMVVAIVQALNGIIIEMEDNSRGGWLRPDTWDKD